ncbi:MAG: histidine kinase dimerization/phospho-acceptor domain-containing protein [Gammaproteobacteria bacterium]|nr:histidine kinase dimerization/phospho-acceptor domain-containing protein [Gammaproteobacteria bacterium]
MLSRQHSPGGPMGAARHAAADTKLAVLSRTNHDMRSPLSVILGVFELLEESTGLDEGERRYLALGSEAAESLLQLADALRLHASLERGQLSVEAAPLDLPALTREVLDAACAAKGAAAVRPEPMTESGQALGDIDHLRGALSALARHMLSQVGETAESAALHRSLTVLHHGNQVVAQIGPPGAAADALPAERPAGTLQPGSCDLHVSNAVRLIDLMGGKVNVDPDGGRLTISLPAASL